MKLAYTDILPTQRELAQKYSNDLKQGINQVFNSSSPGTRHFDIQQQLTANVTKFGYCKASQAQIMLSKTDEYSKKKLILKKLDLYQKVEHNTTVARARTAKQYDVFLQEQDIYPNIKWLASRSADPREEHRAFYGLVLAANDPFWKTNFPGNLWNCKCDWTNTDESSTAAPKQKIKASQGLEGNPAITKEIFSSKATWLKKAGKEGIKLAEKEIRQASVNSALASDLRTQQIKQTIIEDSQEKEIMIGFNKISFNHIAHDSFDNPTYKNLLIPHLDKLVEISKYTSSAKNIKDNPMVAAYHYFEIELLNKTWLLNIREMKTGEYVLYALTKK